MAPHSSTLAWKIPWMEEPGRLQSMGSQSWTWLSDFTFNFHFSLSCIGKGNGNPFQCSCLENPRDGGAWWATVYGVAQSWTRLKRLSSSSSSSMLFHQWANCAFEKLENMWDNPFFTLWATREARLTSRETKIQIQALVSKLLFLTSISFKSVNQ